MNAPLPTTLRWRKSSHSAANNECIEIADLAAHDPRMAVRDSKVPGGPVLVFDAEAFAAFLVDVKTHRLDA